MKVNLSKEQIAFIKESLSYSKQRIMDYQYGNQEIGQRMRGEFNVIYGNTTLALKKTIKEEK